MKVGDLVLHKVYNKTHKILKIKSDFRGIWVQINDDEPVVTWHNSKFFEVIKNDDKKRRSSKT
jgi:hypothetical protein